MVPLVLAVDGTKGPHTPTSIDPASPLNAIAGDYRALGYIVEHVEYPGGILAGVAGWTQNYDDSVAIGTSRLRDRIAVQEHMCSSSTRYVLLGYSQGARIVGDLAAEIDRGDLGTDLAARVQVRLYADPVSRRRESRSPSRESEPRPASLLRESGHRSVWWRSSGSALPPTEYVMPGNRSVRTLSPAI